MSKNRYLAPFIHTEKSAPHIYLTHIAALMPCVAGAFIFYGLSAITLVVGCAAAFMLLDNAFGKMVRRDGMSRNYTDFSSIEAGIVYALMLPPGTSIIVALTGVLFGSFVVKQFFGGAGNNILNPACVARLCVEMLFPAQMAMFKTPLSSWFDVTSLIGRSDSVISASDPQSLFIVEILTGNYAGYLGMGCAVLIIAMWVYQILKGTVRIYAPVAYLTTLILLFPLISSKYMPGETSIRSILIYILSSGVLYVAVYMLGDFTTMPSRRWGGVAAGIICAAMTTVLLGRVSDMCAVLAPVMATNFMSFEIDFFSKTIARRGKIQQREVKVNR